MEDSIVEPASHKAAAFIHGEEYDLSLPPDVLQAVYKLRDSADEETMNHVRERLETEFGFITDDFKDDLSIGHLESLAALIYGPFLYGRDILNDTYDVMLRVKNAFAQDAVTDGVLWAGQAEADPRYAGYINTMLTAAQEVSKNPRTRVRPWLNAVKGEVAIIRALRTDGWVTRLPNYADKQGEVLEWDINNYIDFIAERDGRVLFIDAKARLRDEDGQINKIATLNEFAYNARPYIKFGLPPSLMSYERALTDRKIKHVTITVPTAFDRLPDLSKGPNSKTNLEAYGVSSEQATIINQVNNLRWVS